MKTPILILSFLFILTGFACKPKAPAVQQQPEITARPVDFQKMITAKVFTKEGKEADFISAAQVIINNTRKEEGCLGYSLYQDPFEKTSFIFVESYKNQAAIDAHFAAPYFEEFGTKTADMTAKPMEVKILDIAGEK
jgi:quinol monooxygenase YgiN